LCNDANELTRLKANFVLDCIRLLIKISSLDELNLAKRRWVAEQVAKENGVKKAANALEHIVIPSLKAS